MDFHIYPTLYALMYIVVLLFTIRLGKKAQIGRTLILMHAICAVSSIVYYNTGSYSGDRLELLPYLYLFVTTFICILPFLNTEKVNNTTVKFSSKTDKLLDGLSLILWICSFWWFVELLFIGSDGIATINFNANYEGIDYTGERISWLGRKFKLICLYSINIVYFLFFYQLAKKKNRLLTIILGFGTLASPFDALMTGHRFIIVFAAIRYIIFYLLFQLEFSNKTKRVIRIIGLSLIALFAIGLFLITASRFDSINSPGTSMMTWITLYSGEGPLRFNLQAWDMNIHTQGDNTFTLLKDLLGMNPAIDFEAKEMVWGSKHGLQYAVYYTFIGDLFFDFGKIGTLLFVIAFAFLAKLLLNNYDGRPGTLLIVAMMLQFVMFGAFYNPYILYSSQVTLLITIVFSLILNHLSKQQVSNSNT